MKAVLQRVQEASVSINGDVVSHISKGFLILLGIEAQDGEEQARILANKTASLRVLVVSNFTLCADCKKGKRPSFTKAAPPKEAKNLYEVFCGYLKDAGISEIKTGCFGADMKVSLVNDGPVTILLDTKEL